MKKFNFGKIFALMAAAAVFMLAGCDQLNDAIKNTLEQPKTAEAAGATELAGAFADPSVKVIKIQSDIKADTLKLSIAGDKTISIPGGKETAIGSLELSAGSHVKIMNGSGGTAKSVSGALAAAYSEQNYDGWATFVIWDQFKIPEGATFDLAGEVRLVFRVAEVEGTLKAEIEDSILGAGGEAPVITGGGKVQTSREADEKTPELAATGIKNSDGHKELPPAFAPLPPVALAITAAETGIMDKGGTRQFTANRAVTWTVEGGDTKNLYNMDEDTKSVNTTISDTGLLTIAADETNITLTVRATSGEETETETVKVKGWKAIKSVKEIFGKDAAINGITHGADKWVAVGGTSNTGKITYSTDGESWTGVTSLSPSNVVINKVVYDGPENNKKFIALADGGVIYSSTDGMNWTSVSVSGNSTFDFNGAAYGNEMYIAVADVEDGYEAPYFGVAMSADGTTWTLAENGTLSTAVKMAGITGYGIASRNDNFIVAFGYCTAIAKTTNGTDMALIANTAIKSPKTTAKGYPSEYAPAKAADTSTLQDVIFAGSQWILAGDRYTLVFSEDMQNWTPVSVPPDPAKFASGMRLNIAYGNGKLIIGNSAGNLAYTSLPLSTESTWTFKNVGDDTDWTTGSNNTLVSIFAIGYGDNKFIVTGPQGKLAITHEETLE
jgi:hypothetical protein